MIRLSNLISLALPPAIEALIGFLLGIIIGSYLATILWRWPRGSSANIGRSHCDRCERELSWYELIPLAGPIFAGGKCRSCGAMIDHEHSLVELTSGMLGAYLFATGMVGFAPIGWLLVLLAWFDARYLWLPDRLVAVLAILALITPLSPELTIMDRLAGGAIGYGIFWVVRRTYRALRKREGLGGGDAKLFGAIGLSAGALQLPTILLIACLVGLADAGVRVLCGADRTSVRLPLGAYLCGTMIAMILLQPIMPSAF